MKKFSVRVALMVIIIVSVSSTCSFILTMLLKGIFIPWLGVIESFIFGVAVKELIQPIMTVAIAFLLIGSTISAFLTPLTQISKATQKIANGDFSVRIKETKSDNEISRLQKDFNRMAKALEGNELLQKDFAANMSHQFKTPLSIIKGYSSLLSEETISDEDRIKYANLITRESERLARLSENILRLSKLEAQEFILSPKEFLLDDQILQAILRLQPKWEEKNIEFTVDIPMTYYTGDEELLSQVWFNLVENAIRYSESNSEITVTLIKSDSQLTFTIADNGIGMDEETKNRAFSRFYRGTSAHGKSGSGLGLPIAARIIELHGGTISIDSAPEKGTTVSVILPLADAPEKKKHSYKSEKQ